MTDMCDSNYFENLLNQPENYKSISKVMYVDDEPIIRLDMNRKLKNMGLDVILRCDGLDAIEFYTSHDDIELIFMDINMPEIDGLSATKEIRNLEKINGKKRVPIVAITAYSSYEKEYKKLGFDGFLTKPINMKVLMNYIDEFIE